MSPGGPENGRGGRGKRMTNSDTPRPAVLAHPAGIPRPGEDPGGEDPRSAGAEPCAELGGRHREGKVLAGGCTGWVAGLGSDLTCPVSQVSALSTEGAAGPRPPARDVLGEKRRGERFDPGKQSPAQPMPSEPQAMSTDLSFSRPSSPLHSPPGGPASRSTSPRRGCVTGRATHQAATGRVCHAR